MLTKERNEALTRVGPGTPMGELLRRYWYPVAFETDLDSWPIKKVRLLGEDFALYRSPDGSYGIIQEKCPHRHASLVNGIVEADGIRCGYHGWCYDKSGQCIDQPAEPPNSVFKDKIQAQAGLAEVLAGMVWAYIGPRPAPALPRFDVFVMDGLRDVGHSVLPCNWLQIMENSVDPYHVEHLHGRFFEFVGRHAGFDAPSAFTQAKHVKVGFDPFEWGILKRRVLEGRSEADDDWAIGHPLVFPEFMRVGGAGIDQMQIRVPIDDTHTWSLFYSVHHPDGAGEFPSHGPLVEYEYVWMDDDGNFVVDYIEGQDVMAWVSQGEIADRTAEHIGKSDAGIIVLRRMFREQMELVASGKEPTVGFIREHQDRIDLPCEKNKFGAGAAFAIQWIRGGSMRYSPQVKDLLDLHAQAAAARGDTDVAAELNSAAGQ